MAEKKKGRKRKEEYVPPGEEVEKPSKEEYAVAKWMRKNVPIKKTKFLNHNVEYFTAFKAVDALMESHWAKPAREGATPMLPHRAKVLEFLDTMLRHKFFHRAKKVPVTEQELKARRKGDKKKDDCEEKKKDDTTIKQSDGDNAPSEGGKTESGAEKEKRKRKIRLEMHLDQYFEDGNDAYVWIYDPVPVYYWFFGALLVLGAIGVCLFPLWPPSVRKGVYYLSLAAAGFLVLIIGLAVLRVIIFCIVWVLTLGKHHIWLLPNLTEDVGFLASFWPLYQYEYRGGNQDDKKDLKKKKKKKDKDSDAEEEDVTQKSDLLNTEKSELSRQSTADEDRPTNEDNSQQRPSEEESRPEAITPLEDRRASESESESSQRSSTGRDFEMVDGEDLEPAS